MATGRFLDDPALGTITVAGIDSAADQFLVWDDSATQVKPLVASQLLNRTTSTADISHLSALANLAAVDAANDKFLVWDASATAFKTLTATEILDRILTTADITSLSSLANLAAVDQSTDKFLVWDTSALAWKTLTASEIGNRLDSLVQQDYTSSPTPLASTDSGKMCTNIGSTVVIEFDLPAATAGLRFQFARVAAYAVRLDPNGTETIGSGGAGKYLELQSAGQVTLRCLSAGKWTVETETGITDWEP